MPTPTMDAMLVSRLFTVREANAFLPRLTEIFGAARLELERAQEVARELSESGHPIADVETVAVDVDAPMEVRERQREVSEIVARLRTMLAEVAQIGAEVKAADGLVDFRSRKGGEVVYLCWRFGETEIRHWHDLSSGFGGRAPISDASQFEGDLLQ